MKLFIHLSMWFWTTACFAQAVDVHWGRTDFPPFTILKGKDAGMGVTDRMIDFYIHNMPQYKHEKIAASLQRVLTAMRQGKNTCHGSLLWKEDRAQYVDYLEPNMVQFANGILTTKDKLFKFKPFMGDGNAISFDQLVKQGDVKIRYHAERSYSPIIDKVLEVHGEKSQALIRKTGLKETRKEVLLMVEGRLDGVLGRPEEGLFAVRDLQTDKELVFLSIHGDDPYRKAQVGCAKGEWNAQFIKDLNALTRKYRTSDEFISYYTRWLPQNMRQRYGEIVRKVFAE